MSSPGLRDVFITGTGSFLPGAPVANGDMEDVLGRIGGRASAVGRRALRWNGIESRHYALTGDGDVTHSNAEMCALAVRATHSLQLDETVAIYIARILGTDYHLNFIKNGHPMVAVSTLQAGIA